MLLSSRSISFIIGFESKLFYLYECIHWRNAPKYKWIHTHTHKQYIFLTSIWKSGIVRQNIADCSRLVLIWLLLSKTQFFVISFFLLKFLLSKGIFDVGRIDKSVCIYFYYNYLHFDFISRLKLNFAKMSLKEWDKNRSDSTASARMEIFVKASEHKVNQNSHIWSYTIGYHCKCQRTCS